jgi:hypothetical protein
MANEKPDKDTEAGHATAMRVKAFCKEMLVSKDELDERTIYELTNTFLMMTMRLEAEERGAKSINFPALPGVM